MRPAWLRRAGDLSASLAVLALCGCSTPSPPSRVPSGPPEPADVVEALFLGSGPLAAGHCVQAGVWTAFPRGAAVTLVISATVDAAGERVLAQAADDVRGAIAGRFSLAMVRSADPDPVPEALQISSADVPIERVRASCSPGASGCAIVLAAEGPRLISVRAIQQTGTALRLKVHEFGHAALGLCHLDPARVPEAVMADPPVAQPERFSVAELDAIRAVHAAGLEPGATRTDFVRAGLLR